MIPVFSDSPNILNGSRSSLVLHIHDCHRGWWPTSRIKKVPRGVPSRAEGELHGLAYSANPEF